MSSGDITRGKGEQTSGRDRHREYQPVNGTSASSSIAQSHQDGTSQALGSLRSRIGDKEGPRSLPQSPINTYRSEPQRMEDDRDNRKRTASGMCRASP
jgi:THO complex subunit 2